MASLNATISELSHVVIFDEETREVIADIPLKSNIYVQCIDIGL